jgi:Probable sensor domain DACNV
MAYAFPADLAEQVVARWKTFVARHDRPAPPLPDPATLRQILETAYVASFDREEGRQLRFVLCCAPTSDVPREGAEGSVPLIAFEGTRPLTLESLRALAPAVSPANAAMLVRFADRGPGACEIAGVLNVGVNLARARQGRSIYRRPAPYALVIDVRDAGELHVYRGGAKLATLKGGQLQDELAFSELEFLPISNLFTRGGDLLRPRLRRPARETERETSDFEWIALLNTLLYVVNGVEEHGHGGTLLVVAPGAERTLPIRLKFEVDDSRSVLTDRFVAFVNARHALVDLRLSSGPAALETTPVGPHLEDAAIVAEDALADAAELTARLSAIDGALVVSTDLRVLGFGAEIVLDAARPVAAYEVTGHPQRQSAWPAVDSESFGMRHRSALRCIAVADDAAAFVVSQDGSVSLFWKQDGRVLLKRGVTTANPTMAGL